MNMLETDAPSMNHYAEINPYYLIYCNMNIKVTEDISKEAAENVVRQIGYLHNAVGLVFKDLIKILAFRFPENSSLNGQQSNLNNHPKVSPFMHPQPSNTNRQSIDMEVEESEPPSKAQRWKQSRPNERQGQVQVVQREKRGEKIDNAGEQQSKPPNTNIFDEYAYSNDPPPENNKNKDLNSIKMGVAKIIEGVQRKKREGKGNENKNSSEREEKEVKGEEMKRVIPNNLPVQEREKKPEQGDNPMKRLFSKQIEPQQEPDIFSEFIYESKPAEQFLPSNQFQNHINPENQLQPHQQYVPPPAPPHSSHSSGSQSDSKLWQFLRAREEPAVYEISDDEDNL